MPIDNGFLYYGTSDPGKQAMVRSAIRAERKSWIEGMKSRIEDILDAGGRMDDYTRSLLEIQIKYLNEMADRINKSN